MNLPNGPVSTYKMNFLFLYNQYKRHKDDKMNQFTFPNA